MQAAAAKVRDAYLSYARNTLPAPVTGYVAKRSVQVGQRVSPGTPLMAIVPLDGVWVDANFKEVQLTHMRIGQPVDADRRRVRLRASCIHGKVIGFSAGTGSAFVAAAGAERDRQLDQGRAAPAGAHRSSTRRNLKRIRCASACR